eukprot:GILI01006264.1.p1 GENE.GILI01006264.1~~GILI01006264.1.p1  ORF type:complete len:470 (-),score=111.54 GILI01006264.1:75-1484(-)
MESGPICWKVSRSSMGALAEYWQLDTSGLFHFFCSGSHIAAPATTASDATKGAIQSAEEEEDEEEEEGEAEEEENEQTAEEAADASDYVNDNDNIEVGPDFVVRPNEKPVRGKDGYLYLEVSPDDPRLLNYQAKIKASEQKKAPDPVRAALKEDISKYLADKEALKKRSVDLRAAYDAVKKRRNGYSNQEPEKKKQARFDLEHAARIEAMSQTITVEDVIEYLKNELHTKPPMVLAMTLMFEPQGEQQLFCHRCAKLPEVERTAHPQAHPFFPAIKVQKILAFKEAISTDMLKNALSDHDPLLSNGHPKHDLGQKRPREDTLADSVDRLPALLAPIPTSAAAAEAERKQQQASKYPPSSSVGKWLASFESDEAGQGASPLIASSLKLSESNEAALESFVDALAISDPTCCRLAATATSPTSTSTSPPAKDTAVPRSKAALHQLITHHKSSGRVLLTYPYSTDQPTAKPQ